MPNDQAIAAAIELGRKNAEDILQRRATARARRAEALRQNKRASTFHIRMAGAAPDEAGAAPDMAAAPEEAMAAGGLAAGPPIAKLQTSGFLVAAGDSWFDYPFYDVLKDLEDNYGYNVYSTAHRGDPIEKMAYDGGQIGDFPRQLEKVKDLGAVPKAALLSGGGDDIAGSEFGMLLNNANSPIKGWDEEIVDGVLNDRIQTAFTTMITGMDHMINATFGKSLPILVHGYDYPVADGRGYLGVFGHYLFGPWLAPGFREKNFPDGDLPTRVQMMRTVIDRFNTLVAALPQRFPGVVKYVDLRNTLSTSLPDAYKDSWDNELHPSKQGFEKVTDKFAAAL